MTASVPELRFADRYRVVRRLGSGGAGTVFLAEDERLGRQVAVKRMHADSPEDVARRFDREARLGASLNHPNLVAVYDTVTDPEGVLIVMEYVDGPSLAQALKAGPLGVERTLAFLGDTASALDEAHAHGIIHRDVKPANILLGDGGPAKLADLGIAFAAERATHITRTGTVLGTPSYMAPEQLEGRDVSTAVDVYALGAVAFEALSGRKARSGSSPVEIAHRVATEPAPELREAWPEAPPPAAEALCAAMAADPAKRPASAGELVERLREALEGSERTGETAGGVAAAAAGAGLAAGAEVGAGEGAVVPPSRPEPKSPAEVEREEERPRPEDREDPGPENREERAEPPARGPAHAPLSRRFPGGSAPPYARRRARRAWLAPLAVVLLLALVGMAAVVGGGGGNGGDEGAGDPDQPRTSDGDKAGGGGAASGTPAGKLSPADTVTAFYERAAADDFDGAWALAGPGFREQLGGYESLQGGLGSLESIRFERAEPVSQSADSAQVAIRTVATHTDGVDRCQGTVSLASGGPGGWLISRADVACPQSTRGGAGSGGSGQSGGAGAGAPGSSGGAGSSGASGGADASGVSGAGSGATASPSGSAGGAGKAGRKAERRAARAGDD